ncbi:MAG: zinc transporter, partial [Streblomastix strix]
MHFDNTSSRVLSVIIITFLYFLVELVVGCVTRSVALLSDAVHMLSDLVSQIIGFIFVQISKKGSTNKMSFGFQRSEVLGSLLNSSFLLTLVVLIIFEALGRFFGNPEVTNIILLIIVASIGLLVNIICLLILKDVDDGHGHSHSHSHGHEQGNNTVSSTTLSSPSDLSSSLTQSSQDINKPTQLQSVSEQVNNSSNGDQMGKKKKKKMNMNIQGIFVHMIGDALGSVGVMISAFIILFGKFSWRFYFDPACSLVVCMLILRSAIPLVIRSSKILLLSSPSSIDHIEILKAIEKCHGVGSIHAFHIWELVSPKIYASCHIRVKPGYDFSTTVIQVKSVFHKYNIHNSTVQPEFESASQECQSSCIKSICPHSREMEKLGMNSKDLNDKQSIQKSAC